MLRKIQSKNMGKSDLGWLKSIFHFSFAGYSNPDNMNFGVLRVLNDDLVKPGTGFDTHPHRDMEIISYVVDSKLTHEDSMGNERELKRGHVQYMSAGTGIYHSEHNYSDSMLRFLQIWILPDERGHAPQYGDYEFPWEDRDDRWLQLVSSHDGPGPIKINQDANIYVTEVSKGKEIEFRVEKDRQAYMVIVEGESDINGLKLEARDALEIVEESVKIKAKEKSHIIAIEMKKEI